MSAGGAIGAIVGGVIGFVVAGPAGAIYGASIGFSVGMLIDPLTPDVGGIGDPLPDKLGVTPNKIGIPIPDLLGTGSIKGNLLFYGGERSEPVYSETSTGGKGGGSAPKQVSGYSYYMSWGIGICIGEVDEFYSIWQDEKCIWSGNLTKPVSGGQETIVIEDFGSAIVSFGTQDQAVISSVGKVISDPTLNTPYRGLCWIYFNDCYIGKNNRMPSIRVVLRKTPELSFNSNHIIEGYDYNPAHAIWYILNNLTGLPTSWLNETNFSSVADTLSDEGRGISILFGRQQKVVDYIESINAHVDGIVLYGNDGKFSPKLIRDDYGSSLPTINEDVLLEEPTFHRGSWIDTINEVKVIYSEIISRVNYKAFYGIGRNNYTQTGVVNGTTISEFTQVGDMNFDPDKVACGRHHTLLIKSDGTLWGTGYNNNGELGLGEIYKAEGFTQVGTAANWDKIACGWYHSFGIKTDGTLWATGTNGWGQLGLGVTGADVLEFTQVGTGTDWHSISAGWAHSFALKTDWSIWATGTNSTGQLGLGNYDSKDEFTLVSDAIWKSVECAFQSSLAIDEDDKLWVTGYNNAGDIGLGESVSDVNYLWHVRNSVAKMTSFYGCTLIIKIDGSLWGTGENWYGELGLGDENTKYQFTQVGTDTDWDIVTSGYIHTMALKTNGTMYGTGYGNYYQLANGDYNDRNVFTQEETQAYDWINVKAGENFTVAMKQVNE